MSRSYSPALQRARSPCTKKILCVDAEDESRLMIAELLYEHEVDFALTRDDAVQLAHSRAYDLYVVDPGMPGCDGPDLLRELRFYDRAVPVVLYTRTEARAPVRIAAAYLQKPLKPGTVRETLVPVLTRRGQYEA